MESQHKKKQCPTLLYEIKKTRNEINLLDTQEIVFVKQKYYEVGPKASKILARRLQKDRRDSKIYKIKDPVSGDVLYKQKELLKTFQEYYKGLYTVTVRE